MPAALGLELTLTKNFLAKHTKVRPVCALVLGSGLASVAGWVDHEAVLRYEDIPNFPRGDVAGHGGRLIFGHAARTRTPLVVFEGRVHYYEGIGMRQAAFPAYVAHAVGARILIATNAAGGLNPDFAPGDVMLIRDHINLMGDNPLRGPLVHKSAERFTAMSGAYDTVLLDAAFAVAGARGIRLQLGVYAAMSGPAYETDAELNMLYAMGADAVGMSTVPEVMAARHLGLRVMGLSVIANDAYPHRRREPQRPTHEDVLRVTQAAAPQVQAIIEGLVERGDVS
jgi:purine-nucleoside phosphorylase